MSPSSTHPISFILVCLLWTFLLINMPTSAMPADAKDSMHASMGTVGEVSTQDAIAANSSADEIEDLVQATRKPYNCSQSHRAHSNDSNKFQVQHNNMWWDQVCQTGLIWNQTLCRCDYDRDAEDSGINPECTNYRPHPNVSGMYEQEVNGEWQARDCNLAVTGLVWNQTFCRCVWGPDGDGDPSNNDRSTPCDTMLNVTFEKGLVDEAKNSFLELASGSVLALRHYRTPSDQLSTAAYFQSALMTVWYFAGNEMSGSLRVEFRFKAEDSPLTRNNYQILLSNGCNVTKLGYTTPTLAIGYRADDSSFLLALHTANTRKAIVCARDVDPFGWHQVSLIYEDGMLLFRVDDQPCVISSDFSGEVQKTSCPLTIGADPLEKESKYIGYLDDLVVARHCRRFVEQTLVAEDEEEKEDAKSDDKENGDDDRVPAQPSPLKKSGPADDKSYPRTDKSAVRVDKSAARGDKSVPRGDKPARRGDKSAQRGDKSTRRVDKLPRRGDKSADPDKSAKPHKSADPVKSAQRGNKMAQKDRKSVRSGELPAPRVFESDDSLDNKIQPFRAMKALA